MMATKNYTSIYNVKDMALNTIMPKYFDVNKVNTLNSGLLGFITEMIGSVTEDSFNTISAYIGERFPSTAVLPETIYNYLNIYQYNDILAKPSEVEMFLFVPEDFILSKATASGANISFTLDQNTIIDIEGKYFMLDYDIVFTMKKYKSSYIYTIKYDFSFQNDLSKLNNPYIKNKVVKIANSNYIALNIRVHQVSKTVETFNITTNDKINIPSFNINHTNQLANFEVFYKAPKDSEYTQLKKYPSTSSVPTSVKFCYYEIIDTDEFKISFARDIKHFTPEFNSEIEVHIYTTTGTEGNFTYSGDEINVITTSEKYPSNEGLIMFGDVISDAVSGRDVLTFDEMKEIVIAKMTTVDSLTTETDLQLHFNSLDISTDVDILFIKKRDDVFERLFSSFILMKKADGDFYKTNTCFLETKPGSLDDGGDFDYIYDQSSLSIIKPGRIFVFKNNSIDTLVPTQYRIGDAGIPTSPFKYTNPFLITLKSDPTIVGYYLNSVDSKYSLSFNYLNDESIYQFIVTKLSVYRNAMTGGNKYTLNLEAFPSAELDVAISEYDDNNNFIDHNIFKIIGIIEYNGENIAYFNFRLTGMDAANNTYNFTAELETNDYINGAFFNLTNVRDLQTNEVIEKPIPMTGCKISLLTFYKYTTEDNIPHEYGGLYDENENEQMSEFTLTNIYNNEDSLITFIQPYNLIRSYSTNAIDTSQNPYNIISSVPFVGSDDFKTSEIMFKFINLMGTQYASILNIVQNITNNYSIDLKFYNTYGRSRMFTVGEEQDKLDKVNISIYFKVSPIINTDSDLLVRDLKIFIKSFIEDINDNGYNSLYISNLIQEIENTFEQVKYLKFQKINDYSSDVQVIDNLSSSFSNLTSSERRNYVPEFLTIGEKDIRIDLI
ncbi:MAG: hypothetical protein PHF63_00835 [Herbinix sp.]|nr:hypothetical protein [Herbinix sp.]